jgi:peptide/nickel transport system ATP-binding protein
MAILLDVQNLSTCVKKDGKIFKILDNVSFTIQEGEILGLAGESGCGKSITALSIPNLLPQEVKITNGKILYKSQDLASLSEKELNAVRANEISVIFQDIRGALNPLIKVGRQITESLESDGKQNDKQTRNKAMEVLKSLGFENPEKIFNAYPHQLSGGMCQRVMTAIALICKPKLLLGDEPSSSLDKESQQQCLSLLMEMNKNNKMSLLIISHDLSIIRQFCSRFLIMYAGRIMEEGPSQSLFSPRHPYTKALLNAIPDKNKRGKKLENIPGKAPSVEEKTEGCPFSPRCSKAQAVCRKDFPPAIETDNTKVFCYYPDKDF